MTEMAYNTYLFNKSFLLNQRKEACELTRDGSKYIGDHQGSFWKPSNTFKRNSVILLMRKLKSLKIEPVLNLL